ncbi:1-aminocyclopropane-1-carboxylate synthase [Micractinium conductrix]|uniref:1-aminocyclopropane-1-carboxylate synthase n=1 Tax=Micractinium conductrix TaxID=554055 RepID=A0A2P6VRC9_9CHLO|nr:1-aminocyclopropane-1-carboxylate synthase [Micractinium conductrix]|eukprot:PSC76648.1 1-aminocyclopropane-1-carboxylate synthase [Micractinium conductrix]
MATNGESPRAARSGCSARSNRLLKPMLSYIGAFIQAQSEGLWDAEAKPDGWIPLVVAENKLGNSLVLEKLEAVRGFPPAVMNYSGMKGIPEFQAAMASLLEEFVVRGHSVNPADLCISSGCSAILDNLFYCLCDEGDGVLIPAPYYPAFDNDLQAKCRVHPLPFYLTEPGTSGSGDGSGGSIRQQLDAAAAASAARGVPVRSLLITNPNNPLGTLYEEDTLLEMLRWCLDNKVHYISDEIYALSVYKQASFVSAITLAQSLVAGSGGGGGSNGGSGTGYSQRAVDTYVHLVYGLSKDWCGSGLRVGLLYSRNARLQQALNPISAFASISNHTQWALAQVLGDHDWAAGFLQQNCALLERSYDALAGTLRDEGIPFLPAVGGMFVWVDLRQWLPEASWEAELSLWRRACDEGHLILTPGADCHAAEPGFFRLCFAWMPAAALPEAVHRLKRVLKEPRGAAAAPTAAAQ